jgi:uncharacterized membrane protein YdjX (TVP38/TMEM64 family)
VKQSKLQNYLYLGILVCGMILAIYLIKSQGDENIRQYVHQMGLWGPLILFGLRFISVVIPAVPGTAFSVLAGSLFGFWTGVIVVCLADLLSCSISFSISRFVGRDFVLKIMGENAIARIDTLCQSYLENNFLLMTGFLMTGFFDFLAYGIGLTKMPILKFFPALVVSVILSKPPIVALAAGLFEGGKQLLIFAAFGMIGLGIITHLLKKNFLTSNGK